MKVRVIRQHNLKAQGFFEKCQGKEFYVIWKREGGYDVDLTPLGFPGTWGFMYDDEVEETDQSPDLVGLLAEHSHNFLNWWIKSKLVQLGRYNPDGSFTIVKEEMEGLLKQAEVSFQEFDDLRKTEYREKSAGKLRKITNMFRTAE